MVCSWSARGLPVVVVVLVVVAVVVVVDVVVVMIVVMLYQTQSLLGDLHRYNSHGRCLCLIRCVRRRLGFRALSTSFSGAE